MKIGIITFWGTKDNYGQVLQCYALQQYLISQGHEPFLIRYNRENDVLPDTLLNNILKVINPKRVYSFFQNKQKKHIINKEASENNRQFETFYKNNIICSSEIYNSYDELKKNPPKADCYVTGSDQVWNFFGLPLHRCINQLHVAFLDFGDTKIRKEAFSVSWGVTSLKKNFVDEIKPLIQKFDKITVREESGLSLCNLCGVKNAEWTKDPTMFLSADVYRNLYKKYGVQKKNNPYIFFYYLDNGGKFNKKSVFDFAKKNNLEVVYVSANMNIDDYKKEYPTIPEWLCLIDNAEYVITNSFHGTVFSILFNKKFSFIKLTGKSSGMNTRFESLLKITNYNENWLNNSEFEKFTKV
ncbi:polysaccharide pyruvyl transferase family protein [Treponema sp.]|uniref:polysaccharide pyruvyl transferase family protein n=1 Tax=Treponema sp. TaxID=166 RepID=UPI003FD6CA97